MSEQLEILKLERHILRCKIEKCAQLKGMMRKKMSYQTDEEFGTELFAKGFWTLMRRLCSQIEKYGKDFNKNRIHGSGDIYFKRDKLSWSFNIGGTPLPEIEEDDRYTKEQLHAARNHQVFRIGQVQLMKYYHIIRQYNDINHQIMSILYHQH